MVLLNEIYIYISFGIIYINFTIFNNIKKGKYIYL